MASIDMKDYVTIWECPKCHYTTFYPLPSRGYCPKCIARKASSPGELSKRVTSRNTRDDDGRKSPNA